MARRSPSNIFFFLSPKTRYLERRPRGLSGPHREALLADAAHREAVVAGVHRAGQHLVQVHGGVLVPQQTPRPAHARAQQSPCAFP